MTKAQMQRVIDGLRDQLKAAAVELDERRRVGGMLSNIAYNLAQPSRTLDERARHSCDEARREWDQIARVNLYNVRDRDDPARTEDDGGGR